MTTPDTVAQTENVEISLIGLMQVIADNLRLLVFGPLFIGLLALGLSFLIRPVFTAKVLFIPPKQQQSSAAAALSDLGVLGGAAGAIAGVKNPADQYAGLAKSRSVADNLIKQFNLTDRYHTKIKDDAHKVLAENTKIQANGKDGLISIEVEDEDPQVAADISNAYVEELRKLLNRVALTEAQQRRVFFEKQVQEAKTALVRSEIALKTSGVDSSALKVSSSAALEGVARLKAQISVQEVKLAAMRGYLAESAPDFKQAQTELAALRSQMERADKGEEANGSQSDYVARFRDFKYQEALLGMYLRQFELARVDESREGAVIQVVDFAEPPQRKSKPKKAVIAVFAILGSGFALFIFVFARFAIRSSLKDPSARKQVLRLRQTLRRSLGRG